MERLITPLMWRNIVVMGIYELIVLFVVLYAGDKIFDIDESVCLGKSDVDYKFGRSILYTMVFNIFVFLQLFNEINVRRLDNSKSYLNRGIITIIIIIDKYKYYNTHEQFH